MLPFTRLGLRGPAAAAARRTFAAATTKTEYVHPLSQLVLEHLQKQHSNWAKQHGLERLQIHPDGTFTLSLFPPQEEKQGGDSVSRSVLTTYDEQEKKHYLVAQISPNKVGRFILQDNLKPAWHDNKSTPEKIQKAVDDMIQAMDGEIKK